MIWHRSRTARRRIRLQLGRVNCYIGQVGQEVRKKSLRPVMEIYGMENGKIAHDEFLSLISRPIRTALLPAPPLPM